MAKSNSGKRQVNKINLQNLTERDRDFLSLDTSAVMEKYSVEKQAVYDRRFALNKKLREAGLTLEEVLNRASGEPGVSDEDNTKKASTKKSASKKGKQANAKQSKPEAPKQEEPKHEETAPEATTQDTAGEVVKYDAPTPVVMRPIEMKFENFSIKLNGVPKKIAINPDTNAIEIDL